MTINDLFAAAKFPSKKDFEKDFVDTSARMLIDWPTQNLLPSYLTQSVGQNPAKHQNPFRIWLRVKKLPWFKSYSNQTYLKKQPKTWKSVTPRCSKKPRYRTSGCAHLWGGLRGQVSNWDLGRTTKAGTPYDVALHDLLKMLKLDQNMEMPRPIWEKKTGSESGVGLIKSPLMWPKSEVRHQTKGGSAWNSTMVLPAILNGWPRQVWSQWGCLSKPAVALPRVSLGYTLGMCRGYKWTHQLVSSRPRLISAFQSIRVRAISFP